MFMMPFLCPLAREATGTRSKIDPFLLYFQLQFGYVYTTKLSQKTVLAKMQEC